MSTIKRIAWATSLATVLSDTQLAPASTGITNGTFSAAGTAYDNGSGLYLYGRLIVVLGSLTPTTGAYLQFMMLQSSDGGTTYEDAASSTNPAGHAAATTVMLNAAAGTKLAISPMFDLPPGIVKFQCLNGSGVSLANSGNSAVLDGGYLQQV